MRTREQVFNYLIQASPLFLKQVIKVEETKNHIVVQDLRKSRKLHIPDNVVQSYEFYLTIMKKLACKASEYDGVHYLIICKE